MKTANKPYPQLHALALACILAVPALANAQVVAPEQAAKEAAPGSKWALGLGVGIDREAYRDFDNKVQGLPLLMYENDYISFFGASLDVKLPSAGPVNFRLRARYSQDGYEAKDSPFLAGMAERKAGLWIGAAATWRTSVVNIASEVLSATGASEGQRFKLELNRGFRFGNFNVTPRVSANWYDKKYVDYYYGVRAGEVRAGRRAYQGDATTNIEVGARLGYAISGHSQVFLDASTISLGKAIKDSPLVDSSTKSGVRIGYLYNF